MYSVHIDVEPDALDVLVAELGDAGTLGIVEGAGFVQAFFEDYDTAARFGSPAITEATDWVKHTEESWPPLLVGEKFFVVAPWRTEPTPPGRMRLELNPGTQCGTGQHPCTQKCLEAMERLVKPGCSVLDVGSGSGILSQAALLLGAKRVVACDIEEDSAHLVPFFLGSVDAVKSNSFDVVVANISEDVVGVLYPDLARIAPVRILSGFQDEAGQWTCVVR